MPILRVEDSTTPIEVLRSRKGGAGGDIYGLPDNKQFLAKRLTKSLGKVQNTERYIRDLRDTLRDLYGSRDRIEIAGPLKILYSADDDTFWGYLMGRAPGKSWDSITRSGDLHLKILECQRLANKVAQLHDRSTFISDWNPQNFLVDHSSGWVTLIDTDAFHVRSSNGKIIGPGFMFPNNSPPEMRQNSWHSENISEYQDRWGLAVLIYSMLVGVHPFYTEQEFIVEDEIVAAGLASRMMHFCPHPEQGTNLVKLHGLSEVTTPPWLLPEEIGELFWRCFEQGFDAPANRPRASEWNEALARFETSQCSAGHHFPNDLDMCCYCNRFKWRGRS
jgi:DNA-binding helix-hairpin-helix protein with protein kinase domain